MGSCGWTRWTGPVRLMRNSAEAVARSSAAAECVKKRRVLVLMLVFSRLQRGEPSAAEPQPACPERLEMELAPHLARLSVLAGRDAVSLSARLAMTHMSACRFSIPSGFISCGREMWAVASPKEREPHRPRSLKPRALRLLDRKSVV